MRAHGVRNYPDAKLIDGSIYRNFNPSLNINPSSPAFQQATKKCAHGQPELVGPGWPSSASGTAGFPIATALLVGALLSSSRSPRASTQPTPAFQTPARKCGYRDEQLDEESRSRIAFVRCLCTHGVARLPYPTANGHASAAMVGAQGIDRRCRQSCRS
jgi:hypothetical protein